MFLHVSPGESFILDIRLTFLLCVCVCVSGEGGVRNPSRELNSCLVYTTAGLRARVVFLSICMGEIRGSYFSSYKIHLNHYGLQTIAVEYQYSASYNWQMSSQFFD